MDDNQNIINSIKYYLSSTGINFVDFNVPPSSAQRIEATKFAQPLGSSLGEPSSENNSVRLVGKGVVEQSHESLELTAKQCRKCRLCETRKNVVFGAGKHEKPSILFVGEGPGTEEDKLGLPFVGKAGELLTSAITKGLKLSRDDVYICNVVKCRPPENRTPLPDEVKECSPYLYSQLKLIQPQVIVCLGGTAQKAVTAREEGILKLRGKWLDWEGIPVMPTVHPVYVLRNPSAKRDFWEDLKKVMEHLGM